MTLSNRTLSPSWWEARLEHLDLLRFPCCWLWSFPFISFISFHFHSRPFISFHFCSFHVNSCLFNSFPFLSIPFPSLPFISFPFLFFHFHSDSKTHRFYCNRTFSPSWWEAHLEHSGILGFPCCWLLSFSSISFHFLPFPFISFPFISFHVHVFPFMSIHVLFIFLSCPFLFLRSFPFRSSRVLPVPLVISDVLMSCCHRFLCNRTFAPSWWEAHLEHSEFPGFPCSSIFISFYFHSCPFNSFHFISSSSQFLSFSFSSFPVPSYPFTSCHFLSFPFCFLSIHFISYSFPFVSVPFISFPFISCSFPIISLRVLALPFCIPC